MSESELAGLMKEFGCTDALNLDGGGSMVLLRRGEILNSPSQGTKSGGQAAQPRPVPVMIGLRNRGS
jgi:exopolysaccharide biosynthesis protein